VDLSRPNRPAGASRASAAPSRRLPLLVAVVAALGALCVPLAVAAHPPWQGLTAHPTVVVALVVALFVSELRPIPVPRGAHSTDSITLSTTFSLALLAFAPLSTVLLAQAAATMLDDLRDRRPWPKMAYNVGQYSISLVAARAVLDGAGGGSLTGPGATRSTTALILWLILAGVVHVAINHALVALAISAESGVPFAQVLRWDAATSSATAAVLISLAPVTAVLAEISAWALLLLFLPMLALHYSTAQTLERQRQALRDPLTGLGNREMLRLRAGAAFAAVGASAEGTPARGPSLLLVGVDRFADLVDSLGHRVSDGVLVEIARRLGRVVDEAAGDLATVARVGDEFAVLVPYDREGADALANRLLRLLGEPVELAVGRLLLPVGVGYAVAPEHGGDVGTLLMNAGVALHDPERPLDRPLAYRIEQESGRLERMQLLSDLRVAVDERQFALVFQPQVALTTGEVVGVEALVRWHHPRRGVVPPDAFIGVAESSGLITQVTAIVLDEALAALARLRAAGHDVRMAVNASARHLTDASLPSTVDAALARHGVPAAALTLEVTETSILGEPAHADVVVSALRRSGVTIAVDDYGTGQASLAYLKRLDVDELKIDKTFVIDMGVDPADATIVRSTIELGHDLGLRIVAEGVEDAATFHLLRELGSDVAQGWHVGRPMTEPALAELLERHRGVPGGPARLPVLEG
jgi:diguanylate cyclase (GGDEF)-like protein